MDLSYDVCEYGVPFDSTKFFPCHDACLPTAFNTAMTSLLWHETLCSFQTLEKVDKTKLFIIKKSKKKKSRERRKNQLKAAGTPTIKPLFPFSSLATLTLLPGDPSNSSTLSSSGRLSPTLTFGRGVLWK